MQGPLPPTIRIQRCEMNNYPETDQGETLVSAKAIEDHSVQETGSNLSSCILMNTISPAFSFVPTNTLLGQQDEYLEEQTGSCTFIANESVSNLNQPQENNNAKVDIPLSTDVVTTAATSITTTTTLILTTTTTTTTPTTTPTVTATTIPVGGIDNNDNAWLNNPLSASYDQLDPILSSQRKPKSFLLRVKLSVNISGKLLLPIYQLFLSQSQHVFDKNPAVSTIHHFFDTLHNHLIQLPNKIHNKNLPPIQDLLKNIRNATTEEEFSENFNQFCDFSRPCNSINVDNDSSKYLHFLLRLYFDRNQNPCLSQLLSPDPDSIIIQKNQLKLQWREDTIPSTCIIDPRTFHVPRSTNNGNNAILDLDTLNSYYLRRPNTKFFVATCTIPIFQHFPKSNVSYSSMVPFKLVSTDNIISYQPAYYTSAVPDPFVLQHPAIGFKGLSKQEAKENTSLVMLRNLLELGLVKADCSLFSFDDLIFTARNP